MSLLQLPAELISIISGYTLPDGIENLASTCRTLRSNCKPNYELHCRMQRQWRKLTIGTTTGAETALHFATAIIKDPLIARYVQDANLSEPVTLEGTETYRRLHASVIADETTRAAMKALILETQWFDARQFDLNITEWLDHSLDISEQYCPVALNVLLLPLLMNVKQLTPPLGEVGDGEDFPQIMEIIVRNASKYGEGTSMLRDLQIIRPYSEAGYESRIPLQQLLAFMELQSVEQMYVCSAVAVNDGYTGIPFTWENDHVTSRLLRSGAGKLLYGRNRDIHPPGAHAAPEHDMDFGAFVAAIGTHLGDTLIDLAVTIDEMYGETLSGVVSMKEFIALETAELDLRVFDGPFGPGQQHMENGVPKPWGREDIADLTQILPPSLKTLRIYAKDAYKKLEDIFDFSPSTAARLLPALEQMVLVRLDDKPLPSQVKRSGASICNFELDPPTEPVWRASFRERFGV
nr:hypothetical protein CFP56_63042 [Quercus suber]